MEVKKTKVCILPSVPHFHCGTVTYYPGDIIDIAENLYDPKIMVKINEQPVAVKEPKPEVKKVGSSRPLKPEEVGDSIV